MKPFIGILILLIAGNVGFSTVKIKFKFRGLDRNSILITRPIQGKVLSLFATESDDLIIGGGVLDYTMQINESTFINIRINNEDGFPIAVSKEDSISILVTRELKNGRPSYSFKIEGSNEIAHEIYFNKFYPAGKNFSFFESISKSSKDVTSYYKKAKSYIDSLTSIWDTLKVQGYISNDIYNLYLADTRAVLYNEAIKKLSKVNTGDRSYQSYADWLNIKKVMYFQGNAVDPILLRTYTGSFLYQAYLQNILRDDPSISDTLLKESEMSYYYYYNKDYREQAWGTHLLAIRKLFPTLEMTDYKEIQIFKKYFPNSIYLKKIERITDSMINARKERQRDVQIDAKNYKDLNSIFSNLDGRYFFIDLWATWCVPCLQEFQYSEQLNIFLKKNNVSLIFMSIDLEKDHIKWENFVRKNIMPGQHFIVSEKIQDELLKILVSNNAGTSLFIPRYLFYDKDNHKYYPDLPRPSSGIILEHEIEKILNSN